MLRLGMGRRHATLSLAGSRDTKAVEEEDAGGMHAEGGVDGGSSGRRWCESGLGGVIRRQVWCEGRRRGRR